MKKIEIINAIKNWEIYIFATMWISFSHAHRLKMPLVLIKIGFPARKI